MGNTLHQSLGVPQGTVLGPTLFLLYTNDIDTSIQSEIRLFADDCFIYRPMNSHDDHVKQHQDLISLTKWATTWQMEFFNVDHLQLSRKHNNSQFTYIMNGVPSITVKEHHYLDILLNYQLSWCSHIDQTCDILKESSRIPEKKLIF